MPQHRFIITQEYVHTVAKYMATLPSESDTDCKNRYLAYKTCLEGKDTWQGIPFCHQFVFQESHHIMFRLMREDKAIGGGFRNPEIYYDAELEIVAATREQAQTLFQDFMLGAEKFMSRDNVKKVRCNVYQDGNWQSVSYLRARSQDTIFLPGRDEIFRDVEKFYASQDDYDRFGLPYKRVYMLYGPPGTGKTSLIFTIASHFDKEIFFMSQSSNLDDTKFMMAIARIPSNAILVVEDVDALFTTGAEVDGKHGITYAAFTNTLDGIIRREKIVIFLTTNYRNRLDYILQRPSRVDYMMEMHPLNAEYLQKICHHYFPTKPEYFQVVHAEIRDELARGTVSCALIQKFLFENRDTQDMVAALPNLRKLMIEYHHDTIQLYA